MTNKTIKKYSIIIIFVVCSIISSLQVAYSAELGPSKTLEANNGPSLSETVTFLKEKFPSFIADKYIYRSEEPAQGILSYLGTIRHQTTYVISGAVLSANSCDIKMIYTTRETRTHNLEGVANNTVENNEYKYKFNLSDISSVRTDLFEKDSRYSINGSPIYGLVLSSKNNKIVNNGQLSSEERIPTINQEAAKRLTKAFEHAVQLCGGVVEVPKEEPF